MIAPFELDWAGGAAEARLRRRRPGIDDLPWRALELAPEIAAAARAAWTEGAFSEYASAAAFGALAAALLEAGAPIDLTAMAADFVVDELTHVELNARLAAAAGGASPHLVELDKITPRSDAPPLARAAELAVRICLVGESLSVPVLATAARRATDPLARAVLARIAHDEGPHARLGALVLAWAGDRIAAHRARLAGVALRALRSYAPLWRGPIAASRPDVERPRGAGTRPKAEPSAEREGPGQRPDAAREKTALGLLEGALHRRVLMRAVRVRVVPALAAFGIAPADEDVDELLRDDMDAR